MTEGAVCAITGGDASEAGADGSAAGTADEGETTGAATGAAVAEVEIGACGGGTAQAAKAPVSPRQSRGAIRILMAAMLRFGS